MTFWYVQYVQKKHQYGDDYYQQNSGMTTGSILPTNLFGAVRRKFPPTKITKQTTNL